jgi:hypothetical protein
VRAISVGHGATLPRDHVSASTLRIRSRS